MNSFDVLTAEIYNVRNCDVDTKTFRHRCLTIFHYFGCPGVKYWWLNTNKCNLNILSVKTTGLGLQNVLVRVLNINYIN